MLAITETSCVSAADALLESLDVPLPPPPEFEAGRTPGAAPAPAAEQRLLDRRERPEDRRGEEDAPCAQSEVRPCLCTWPSSQDVLLAGRGVPTK